FSNYNVLWWSQRDGEIFAKLDPLFIFKCPNLKGISGTSINISLSASFVMDQIEMPKRSPQHLNLDNLLWRTIEILNSKKRIKAALSVHAVSRSIRACCHFSRGVIFFRISISRRFTLETSFRSCVFSIESIY